MPEPYWSAPDVTLHAGDCREVLADMPEASVDAVCCDPPYEVGIAGQEWDRTGIAFDSAMWGQVLRVLKPGGHLLAFGSPRTYHRMVCAAEDAGFRIIDQIDWIYTHGKPKGADLARAIDRRRDDREQVLQVTAWLAVARDAAGWTNRRIDALWGYDGMASHWTTQGVAAMIPTAEQWALLKETLAFDDSVIRPVLERLWARKGTVDEAFAKREIISEKHETARDTGLYRGYSGRRVKSLPHTEAARRWAGWNTTLKPAHDPILLARKSTGFQSLVGGLLRHGVGGLNIAACPASGGGWPANILLGHDCPEEWCEPGCPVAEMGESVRTFPIFRLNSKTPAVERAEVDGVQHVTPKPLALMRWLVRLITPPGGIVLDPFAGSGTTGEASTVEGFQSVLIELDPAHAELIKARLSKPIAPTLGLFSEVSDA